MKLSFSVFGRKFDQLVEGAVEFLTATQFTQLRISFSNGHRKGWHTWLIHPSTTRSMCKLLWWSNVDKALNSGFFYSWKWWHSDCLLSWPHFFGACFGAGRTTELDTCTWSRAFYVFLTASLFLATVSTQGIVATSSLSAPTVLDRPGRPIDLVSGCLLDRLCDGAFFIKPCYEEYALHISFWFKSFISVCCRHEVAYSISFQASHPKRRRPFFAWLSYFRRKLTASLRSTLRTFPVSVFTFVFSCAQ